MHIDNPMLYYILIHYPFFIICRFDIEGDEETQLNFTSGEHTQIPTTLIPSPPLQDEPQRGRDHGPFNAYKSA